METPGETPDQHHPRKVSRMTRASWRAPFVYLAQSGLRRIDKWTRLIATMGWPDAANTRRWSNAGNLVSGWDSRTVQLAAMIPAGTRVLEFGAGRMILRDHLPAGCTYLASDIVDRGPGTLVCDLNAAQLPALPEVDVVVFSGVLEYIRDVPGLLAQLQGNCTCIIASYAVATRGGRRESLRRRQNGWLHDYRRDDFIALFTQRGFTCAEEARWGKQVLCKFIRQKNP